SAEIEQATIEAGNGQLAAYGVQLTRMGNFDVNLSPEDEKQLKQLAKDTSYSQLAGGFQNYAQGEMALGAGQGMAQGGSGVDGAFLGAGFGMASGMGMQQANQLAQQQAAQQAAAQQGVPPYGQGGQQQVPPGGPPPGGQAQQAPPPTTIAGPVCASCQAANPAGARFCMGCGQPLAPAVAHCTECGTELPAGAHFCAGCGTRVGG